MISIRFQGKPPFTITVIQVYALTTDAKEAKVDWFYEDLQDLLELKISPLFYIPLRKKRFIGKGLDAGKD